MNKQEMRFYYFLKKYLDYKFMVHAYDHVLCDHDFILFASENEKAMIEVYDRLKDMQEKMAHLFEEA